jgi:hypothetical protein
MELFSVFVIWGLMCWGVAALAGTRGRSSVGFFLLSFIFSPLLGLIVVLVMKNLTEEAAKETERSRAEERREHDRKREHEKQLESLRAVTTSQSSRSQAQAFETAITGSIADELTKLAVLRDNGILTPTEFDTQKARLLGSVSHARPGSPNGSSSTLSIAKTADLSTFDSCKAALIGAGCRISNPSDNTWEILDSAGVTRVVRSDQELVQLAQRYQAS